MVSVHCTLQLTEMIDYIQTVFKCFSGKRNIFCLESDYFGDIFLFVVHRKLQLLFLKVPKREMFDRSDFPDFYTIKSLRMCDFGVKIKKKLQNI
jgi:hypothetical protein